MHLVTDKQPPPNPFDVALALAKVREARAILVTVALAVEAQLDGSVVFSYNKLNRWEPSIDEAFACLRVVQDMLLETTCGSCAWHVPMNLLEALGCALCGGIFPAKPLEAQELQTVVQVLTRLLDELRDELQGQT